MIAETEAGLYPYTVPAGYGDTYFCYVYDAQGEGLTDGREYSQLGVPINNGDFILRYISGLNTLATGFNAYDWLLRAFYSSSARLGSFAQGMLVQPEVKYFDNGQIRFDLEDVAQAVAGVDGALTVLRSQLLFWGARRRKDVQSDPAPSTYRYHEVEFAYPYTLSINNYASSGGVFLPAVEQRISIQDYDFELRRIELALQSEEQASQFKMLLYDQNWAATSNRPILSNYLCHTDPRESSGELAFFPCPPLLYRVNSVLRFDVSSLLFAPTALPQTFQLLFKGVRRIPC